MIAIEEHWTSAGLTGALKAQPTGLRDDSLALNELGDHLRRLEDLGGLRLAAMDEQGVDLQVLSLAPPGPGALAPADAVALSRELNDVAADAVARHPDRFRALATLPLADPAEAAAGLERATRLGAVGVMLYGRTGDTPLDDPRYDEVLGLAASLGQPVFIHPQIPARAVREAAYGGFDDAVGLALSTFAWGWHLEAALATLRLVARGAFDRHPDLQVVLGHWGELLLFWQDRVGSLSRVASLDRPVAEVLRENVHVTASGMLSPALLRHALEVTTADRLMFSTDYPFQHPTRPQIDAFLGELGPADRAAFTDGNARKLFRIDAGVV